MVNIIAHERHKCQRCAHRRGYARAPRYAPARLMRHMRFIFPLRLLDVRMPLDSYTALKIATNGPCFVIPESLVF